MHEQTIRHKDIKPQNILIHRGSAIYTDFGISLDFAQQDSTTTGHPQVGPPIHMVDYTFPILLLIDLIVFHQEVLCTRGSRFR
jgi:serine/threonine protein kinase